MCVSACDKGRKRERELIELRAYRTILVAYTVIIRKESSME